MKKLFFHNIEIGDNIYDVIICQHDTAVFFLPSTSGESNPAPNFLKPIISQYLYHESSCEVVNLDEWEVVPVNTAEIGEADPLDPARKYKPRGKACRAIRQDGTLMSVGMIYSTASLLVADETICIWCKESRGFWLYDGDLAGFPYAFVMEIRMKITDERS